MRQALSIRGAVLGDFGVANATALAAVQRRPLRQGLERSAWAIVDAMAAASVPPSRERRRRINALVLALKRAGVWDRLDLLYVTAAHDQAAACVNWRNPGLFPLVPSNSPLFTPDRGFTGDGATSRIDTGYNPASHAVNYAQDSCHLGLWAFGTATDNVYDCGGGVARINARNGTVVQVYAQENAQNTAAGASGGTARGHTAYSRTSSAEYTTYRDGVALSTFAARASAALGSANLMMCGNPAQFSVLPESAFHAGGKLSPTEMAATYAALRVYMQAVGVL